MMYPLMLQHQNPNFVGPIAHEPPAPNITQSSLLMETKMYLTASEGRLKEFIRWAAAQPEGETVGQMIDAASFKAFVHREDIATTIGEFTALKISQPSFCMDRMGFLHMFIRMAENAHTWPATCYELVNPTPMLEQALANKEYTKIKHGDVDLWVKIKYMKADSQPTYSSTTSKHTSCARTSTVKKFERTKPEDISAGHFT
jgi:hypothetical protein